MGCCLFAGDDVDIRKRLSRLPDKLCIYCKIYYSKDLAKCPSCGSRSYVYNLDKQPVL